MASEPPSESRRDLDFEIWARASAKILRRPVLERARILHDAGLEKIWRETDARWSEALIEDVEAGRLDRPDRYLALCRAELGQRGAAEEAAAPPPASAAAGELANLRQTIQSASGAGLAEVLGATRAALAWPVDKYAWLCAELGHAPERAAHTWAQHGLEDERAREAVHEGWRERLEADPALRTEHQRLVEHYLVVLRG